MKFKIFGVLFVAFLSASLIAGGETDRKGEGQKESRNHGSQLGTMVLTHNGFVLGADEETQDGYYTWSWKGIPFAQPPEGNLRWKAPRPPEYWGILHADTFGSICPQYDASGNFSGSEDCLYLNVWRPRTHERNLPVYFFIHGGGNSIGSGSDPMYQGSRLAPRGNMVVVTTNYRLGPLGWFVLPENFQDSNHHKRFHDGNPLDDSGNYGTLDIIQALRWVRENIEAFGGDPDNITIAGESAGGWNVCTLLISPEAKGLFHKAISESGGFMIEDTNSMEVGRASAQAAIAGIGCTDRACLMSKTPEAIFAAYLPGFAGQLDFSVFKDRFTDGAVISSLGKDALKNPHTYNQVPTILGTNKEEVKLFALGLYGTIPDDQYQAETMYLSMQWQQTGVNQLAADMSANKGQPGVYAYEFDYGAYNALGYNAWPNYLPYGPDFRIMVGSSHTLELPFIFGDWTWYGWGPLIFQPGNQAGWKELSDIMVQYWASFARTGQPHDPGGVLWRPWSNRNGGPKRILLDANDTEAIIQMSDQ
jgi:para-nitrobenzyl esterase